MASELYLSLFPFCSSFLSPFSKFPVNGTGWRRQGGREGGRQEKAGCVGQEGGRQEMAV